MSRATFENTDRFAVDDPIDDMALLRRYVEFGSQDAFSELVGRHLSWVYSTCHKALRDREMADDAAQAVFIILARRASTITAQTRISGWLFNTARFVVKDARKQQARYRRREEIARELASERLALRPATVDTDVQSSLDDAMATLTERDRQALLMHFYEGLSLNEMADVLGIGKEGVKKRVGRALSRLRGRLNGKNGKRAASIFAVAVMLRGRAVEALPLGFQNSVVAAVSVPGRGSVVAEWMARAAVQASAGASRRLLQAALAAELMSAVAVVGVYANHAAHRAAVPVARGTTAAMASPVYESSRADGVTVGRQVATNPQQGVVNIASAEPPYRSGADDPEPQVTPLPPFKVETKPAQGNLGTGAWTEPLASGGPVGMANIVAAAARRPVIADPLPLPPLSQRGVVNSDAAVGVARPAVAAAAAANSSVSSSRGSAVVAAPAADRSNAALPALVQKPADVEGDDVVARCVALLGQRDGTKLPDGVDHFGDAPQPSSSSDRFFAAGEEFARRHGDVPGHVDEFEIAMDVPRLSGGGGDGHMRRMFIEGDGADAYFGRAGGGRFHRGISGGAGESHPYAVVVRGDGSNQLVGRVPPGWVIGKPPMIVGQHGWHQSGLGLCGTPPVDVGLAADGSVQAGAAGAFGSVPEPGLMGLAVGAFISGLLGRRRRR